MEIINFGDKNSLVNKFLAELRNVNVQGDMMRFRRNLERVWGNYRYEISKHLHYEVKNIPTPLGVAPTSVPSDPGRISYYTPGRATFSPGIS